ncbi:MAG: 3-dehydroquinate synthase [Ignavibacteriales bacterium]|nr:3-dehydroquinate synthase [Ignavibacteriales bacterium]
MKKIKIKIPSVNYDIFIGKDAILQLANEIERLNLHRNVLFIIDKNVDKYYHRYIFDNIKIDFNKCETCLFNAKESEKNIASAEKIFNMLIQKGYGRDTLIIAIGGGIVGDIAGFVAATFMRGIQYIQIPTTLLAAVDSSVGGKTGVNFGDAKNIIGSFYQPKSVIIDTNFLKTLNQSEIICGMGEVVKYAFLSDEKFYNFLNLNLNKILKLEPDVLKRVIYESIKFKLSVVMQDEKESGIRKILNLGHTFAHALEIEQKHKIKHGQAVVWGIVCSLFLSRELNYLKEKNMLEFLEFLSLLKPHIKIETISPTKIYKIMLKDKKNRAGKIKFVLPVRIGKILIDVESGESIIKVVIKKSEKYFKRK